MKYFTPELIIRMNSRDDHVLGAALEEWDSRVDAYDRHLGAIEWKLPRSVRDFIHRWYLHDAELLAASDRNGPSASHEFTIALRSRGSFVSLHYVLVAKPAIERGVLPPELCSDRPLWKYDELSLSGENAFRHEILLSTGELIKLRFKKLRVEAGSWLLPAEEKRLKAVS